MKSWGSHAFLLLGALALSQVQLCLCNRRWGAYIQVAAPPIVASAIAPISYTDKMLMFDFPNDPKYDQGNDQSITGIYDLNTRRTTLSNEPRYNIPCGGYAKDRVGNIIVYGTHTVARGTPKEPNRYKPALQSVHKYDISKKTWTRLRDMGAERWYATPLLLANGNHVVFGGGTTRKHPKYGYVEVGQNNWDLYNPGTGRLVAANVSNGNAGVRSLYEGSRGNYYAGLFRIHTGLVIVLNYNSLHLVDPVRGTSITKAEQLPWGLYVEWPQSATWVMLPLGPFKSNSELENKVTRYELVVFGGRSRKGNMNTPGNTRICRVTLTVLPGNPRNKYSFSKWDFDTGALDRSHNPPNYVPMKARVGGIATFLPNGKIVLTCGHEYGIPKLPPHKSASRPVTWAQLYDPTAAKTRRLRNLAQTPIARMYHSAALLCRAGALFVGGCSNCKDFTSERPTSKPAQYNEYRLEVFMPPYLYYARPQIMRSPNNIYFNRQFAVKYRLADSKLPVTKVALVDPGANTHGVTFDQLLLYLAFTDKRDARDKRNGVLTVWGPVNANLSPATTYYLYILSAPGRDAQVPGDIYSEGKWVTLKP